MNTNQQNNSRTPIRDVVRDLESQGFSVLNQISEQQMEEMGIHKIDAQPDARYRDVFVAKPAVVETVTEVPHVQYVERIETVSEKRKAIRPVPFPRTNVTERVIEIPKYVAEEKKVEVPQVHVIDRVVEVPVVTEKEILVEKPRYLLQERIIPIPKRTIKEEIVEIPEEEFEMILKEKVHLKSQAYYPANACHDTQSDDDQDYEEVPLFDDKSQPIMEKDGVTQKTKKVSKTTKKSTSEGDSTFRKRMEDSNFKKGPEELDDVSGRPVDEHVYRNVLEPQYKHVPKPVEIPLAHYKPVPVEVFVDRNVPIPVELHVVQEFICPRLRPRYVEVPVAIPVTRTIERPVAVDAFFNKAVLEAYMNNLENEVPEKPLANICGIQDFTKSTKKMTDAEMAASGINVASPFEQLKSFASRGNSMVYLNVEKEPGFFTEKKTIVAPE